MPNIGETLNDAEIDSLLPNINGAIESVRPEEEDELLKVPANDNDNAMEGIREEYPENRKSVSGTENKKVS
jgi:hypothetical protein